MAAVEDPKIRFFVMAEKKLIGNGIVGGKIDAKMRLGIFVAGGVAFLEACKK